MSSTAIKTDDADDGGGWTEYHRGKRGRPAAAGAGTETQPPRINMAALHRFKAQVIGDLCHFIAPNDKVVQNKARKHVVKAFTRWAFDANLNGKLDDIIPIDNIIDAADIANILCKEGVFSEDEKEAALQMATSYDLETYWRFLKQLQQTARSSGGASEGSSLVRIKGGFYTVNQRHQISERQYARLRALHTGKAGQFERNVCDLVERYIFVGGLNSHLSMPPGLLPADQTIELFGTPLNTCSTKGYCSPFAMEEALWGSRGSFFARDQLTVPGLYTANPPYDEHLMLRMAESLTRQLQQFSDKASKVDATAGTDAKSQPFAGDITVVLTLPIWDQKTQRELKLIDSGLDFPALDVLRASPFFRQGITALRDQLPYLDYFTNTWIPVTNTHLVMLSTAAKPAVDLSDLKRRWMQTTASARVAI